MASSQEHPAKRTKLDFSEEIAVLVGADEKRFMVHRAIICDRSKFFRAACAGSFKEGQGPEKIVKLPEVKIALFPSYLQWVYRSEVVVTSAEEDAAITHDRERCTRLVGLYILAQFLEDAALRNAVTDELCRLWCGLSGPMAKDMSRVFRSAPRNCKLRDLLLDWHASHPDQEALAEWYKLEHHHLPKDFFVELAIKVYKAGFDRTKVKNPRGLNGCTYHEHNDEVPPCA